MISKRSIPLALVLSIVTCGIYVIYWFVKLTDEVNEIVGDYNATSGVLSFVFTLVTCGIYSLYWSYKMGEKVEMIKGVRSGNTGILYLILGFFGLLLVNQALIQDTINDKLDGRY